MPDDTGKKQDTRFKAGKSGNPNGRPKGSRSKISEQFLTALCADFADFGEQAIISVRENDPSTYFRTTASLLPRETKLEISEGKYDHWTDEQLDAEVDRINRKAGWVKVDEQ
jgi:hypothetical protein